jgi:hypothetical protein
MKAGKLVEESIRVVMAKEKAKTVLGALWGLIQCVTSLTFIAS